MLMGCKFHPLVAKLTTMKLILQTERCRISFMVVSFTTHGLLNYEKTFYNPKVVHLTTLFFTVMGC